MWMEGTRNHEFINHITHVCARNAYVHREKIREGKIPGRTDFWAGRRTVLILLATTTKIARLSTAQEID